MVKTISDKDLQRIVKAGGKVKVIEKKQPEKPKDNIIIKLAGFLERTAIAVAGIALDNKAMIQDNKDMVEKVLTIVNKPLPKPEPREKRTFKHRIIRKNNLIVEVDSVEL